MTRYAFMSDEWLTAAQELKSHHLGAATDQDGLTVNGTITDLSFGRSNIEMHSDHGPVFGWSKGLDPDAVISITIAYDTARDLILDRTPNALERAIGAGEIQVEGDVDAFREWWHARVGDPDVEALEAAIRDVTE
jgi:hypothetical protein